MNNSNASSSKSTTEVVELLYLANVAVLTLFGNCLVISAFVFGAQGIRTFTNYFVVNLAISDLLVGCISLPFWIIYRIGTWIYFIKYQTNRNSYSQKYHNAFKLKAFHTFPLDRSLISDTVFYAVLPLDVLSGITSILSLAAISLERMTAVRHPTFHLHLSKSTFIIALATAWTIGTLLSLTIYGVVDEHEDEHSLSVRAYTGSVFTLGYVIPLLVIMCSYVALFCAARNMMVSHNSHVAALR